ncbi:hypothetical protein CVT26_004556, partial [Gymnopilus dilepis]
MPAGDNINLIPPPIEDIVKAGQTISSTVSPADNSLAIYITQPDSLPIHANEARDEEQHVYFANSDAVPSERRENLMKSAAKREEGWVQSEECLTMIRKLAIDYATFIKDAWVQASFLKKPTSGPHEPSQFNSDHYRSVYTCFSLFVVLYLPEPGYEHAPIADDLMEWLNTNFIEPSTEEGVHLSALDKPWED